MKIEISIEKEEGKHEGMKEGMGKMMKPTPFQKKVAQMLAKQKGKKMPDESDYEKARELEEED